MRTNHILILLSMLLIVQVNGQDCDKDISTNPAQPYNNHPFFLVIDNDIIPRYNPWINSDFNIGEMVNGNVPPLYINNQIGWQIPSFVFGETFEMKNPFASGTTGNTYAHLHPSGMDFEHLDYKWEDGWELLYVGLGFYPNGEGVQIQNTQRAYDPGVNLPSNPKVPYILMYNRYRGVLRVFANVFTTLGSWDDIVVQLRFNDDGQDGLSGILRHLEPFDRALSQTTNVKLLETYNPKPGGIDRWFSSDFQLGFDPCICGKNQKWFLNFRAITSFEIDMVGRGVEVDMPIANGTDPSYDNDWLTINSLEDELSGGNQIFTKMDGLVEDYKDALAKYEADSEDYADFIEKKEVMDAFQGFVVGGLSGLVPGGGALKSWFLKPKNTAESGTNFANYIKGASKGLLGYGYDQLSLGINPKTSAPKPPDMPTASYSQMRFSGKIKGTLAYEEIGPFFIPGSYEEASSLSNLDPFNYPAYNAPTGLAALLETPEPWYAFNTNTSVYNTWTVGDGWDLEGPGETVISHVENITELNIRIDEPPQVHLNPSIDFDMSKTASYFMIEVVLKNNLPHNLEQTFYLSSYVPETGHIFYQDHDWESDTDHGRFYNFKSPWVLLEDLNQQVFKLNIRRSCETQVRQYLSQHPFPPFIMEEPNWTLEDLDFEVEQINLKILHDNYFHQIGSNGEQVNTTQVFSYILYEDATNVNYLIDDGPWSSGLSGYFDLYIPGLITLGNETITTTHPLVHHVDGNEIVINAQEVQITGPIQVEPGYTLVVQALEQIKATTGASFNPNVHLRIKKDFYDTPVFEYADNAAVYNFCNNSNAYQANAPSMALRERMDAEQAEASANASLTPKSNTTFLTLYPNPARSELTAQTDGAGIDRLTIFDMSTRPVMQASPGGQSLYRMDISSLAPGVYIVQANSGGEVLTEKLVVAR